MSELIYLDNAATTPVDPLVAAAMCDCLGPQGAHANPTSVHAPGRRARALIEEARAEVAALVGAEPGQIVWTSGATEADNLALFGAAHYHRVRGKHIVTSRVEHPAVLDPCRQLEREGFEVSYLVPGPSGIVEPEQLEAALRPDTILASLMHVNNETGVCQDVAAFGRICRERGVILHVDAAQGAGKLPLDVNRDGVDLLSLTAHKVYGPKGIGALCVRREPRLGLVPLLFGGGQEGGLRSGTLPTHQILGMGVAFRLARERMGDEAVRIGSMRDWLRAELERLPGVLLNGDRTRSVPGILNMSFDGVEGESLLLALSDIALSSGSACASTSSAPSYVLRALGRSDRLAQSSLRMSLGRFTRREEVERAAQRIAHEVTRLRAVTPASVWRAAD